MAYGGKFCLGEKCNLNMPPKLIEFIKEEKIITLSADGSQNEYLYEENEYKDPFTKCKIKVENENSYVLTNQEGDKFYYKELNTLPNQIISYTNLKYTIIEKNNTIEYANGLGGIVEIISSGNYIESIVYRQNGQMFTQLQFVYSLKNLIGIKHYEGYYFKYENKYNFIADEKTLLSIFDSYSNQSLELVYKEAFIINKYNVSNHHKVDNVKIDYKENCTIVSTYMDTSMTYYFNEHNLCKYSMDNFGNYTTFTYNDSFEIINQGSMAYGMGNILINGELEINNTSKELEGFQIAGRFNSIQNSQQEYNPFGSLGYTKTLQIVTPNYYEESVLNIFNLYQDIEYKGSLYDSFEFSFLIRNIYLNPSSDSKTKVYLMLLGEEDEVISGSVYELDLSNEEYKTWQLKTLSIQAEQTFTKVRVMLYCEGKNTIHIGAFRLINIKKSIDITYNDQGQITSISSVNKKEEYTYDGYKVENTIDSIGNYIQNLYDSDNRLIQTINPNGTKTDYLYNNANNEAIQTRISNYDYEMIEAKEFDASNNFLIKETDSSGATTEYQYNLGVPTQVLTPDNTKIEYEYYHDLNLKSLCIKDTSNNFGYEFGLMNYINTNEEPRYSFEYIDGNLEKVMLLKDGKTTPLSSYKYIVKNDIVTSLIQQKEYPNGEAYNFIYDDYGQVIKINYVNGNNVVPTVDYEYDVYGKLLTETDLRNSRKTTYTYDIAGRVEQIESQHEDKKESFHYFYDSKNTPLFQIKKYLSFTNYTEALPLARSTSISMEGLFHNYQEKEYFTAFFQNSFDLKNIDETKTPAKEMSVELLSNYNNLPCLRNTKIYSLTYNFDSISSTNNSQTVGFWFKFTNKPTVTSQMLHIGNSTYGVGLYYVPTTNKIQLKRGTLKLYESQIKILPNDWNFICLTQENLDEGDTTGMRFSICINGEIEDASTGIIGMALGNIGIGGDLSKGSFIGFLTGLLVGGYKAIDKDTVLEYYRLTKDLFIEAEAGSFSSMLNYYTFLDDCMIFPLHQNLKNVEQTIGPKEAITQSPFDFDKDYLFNYNTNAHRYMYKCVGKTLVYQFAHASLAGTISMCFVADNVEINKETKRYLFEISSNNQNIGFYINSNQTLCCDELSNGISLKKIEANRLYYFIFSYEYKNNELSYYVYLNNESIVKGGHDSKIGFGAEFELSLGRSFDSTLTSLRGSIDMLMVRDVYSDTEEDYERLLRQSTIENVGHKYNEIGLLEEYNVFVGDTNAVKTSYTQQNKNGVLTGRITKEENEHFSNTYEYDAAGRIIKVNDDEFYTYDAYGFLIEDKEYKYTYDTHGNILTKYKKDTDQTIEYKYNDNRCQDLLTSYNGIPITYDDKNVGNIKTYGTTQFTYEGRRLIKYDGPKVTESYLYNPNGLRIQKEVTNKIVGTHWITNYVYEGDKLLYEETDGKITRFIYDENGMLYSFVYNSIRYYYLRDLQQRIIGIVDENGKYIAGYKYDSYGKHEIIAENNEGFLIALVNPYRYKGYYYDENTELYYCKSRYYVPEWGRFISPDSIEYLDPNSINGMNLYAYCGNDPVNKIDSSGHFAISTFLIGLALSWAISSIASYYLGEHLVSGAASIYGGIQTISTGVSLLAYGPVGWVLGGAAIVLGAVDITFGTAELQQHFTGDNWINDIGISGGLYTGLYIGSSIVSAAVSIGGNYYKTTTHGQIAYNAKYWDKGTFKNSRASLKYHYAKHGSGLTPTQYTQSALDFASFNSASFKYAYNFKYGNASWYFNDIYGVGGYFANLGKIITFWF